MNIAEFQDTVWAYYQKHARDLPWRMPVLQLQSDGSLDAYAIMVSELMLQQTQVVRVIPKFESFMKRFPTVLSLAEADLAEVLRLWSGLGYNRRAQYLWRAAQQVVQEFDSRVPQDTSLLESLPGIGKNTAAAIRAYAFNEPVVFIETNIRTVFIHHFFKDQTNVPDSALIPLIAQSLATEIKGKAEVLSHCREWYWALMDYGTYLKSSVGNASRASKHHVRQSAFAGSRRQLRGQVIRLLGEGVQSQHGLESQIIDERLTGVLRDLLDEGMIKQIGQKYSL